MDPRDKDDSLKQNIDVNCAIDGSKGNKELSEPGRHDEVISSMTNQSDSVTFNGQLVNDASCVPCDNRRDEVFCASQHECSSEHIVNSPHSNVNSNHIDTQEPSSSKQKSIVYKDNNGQQESDVQVCDKNIRYHDNVAVSSSNVLNNSGVIVNNSAFKETKKRSSCSKLLVDNEDECESSSDTGRDDYSLGSEDGCVYTYRGGEHLADLPSSFFSLDMGLPLERRLLANAGINPEYAPRAEVPPAVNNREQPRSRASSPDMDFLEMDFDPGPSNEAESGDGSSPSPEMNEAEQMLEEIEEMIVRRTPEVSLSLNRFKSLSCERLPRMVSSCFKDVPSTSSGITRAQGDATKIKMKNDSTTANEAGPSKSSKKSGLVITHVNATGVPLLVQRTTSGPTIPIGMHVSSGNLISPRELVEQEPQDSSFSPVSHATFDTLNISATLFHLNMAKRLMHERTAADIESRDIANCARDEEHSSEDAGHSSGDASNIPGVVEVPRSMVWSEREACERQITQIGTSACGATAVVNAFNALGVPVDIERINSSIGTRQRANNAQVPRYLLSRAVAGCTAADIVSAIHRSSNGTVSARFFATHPERSMSLSHFLADWISIGAIPILTMNLQAAVEGEIPDAWHHQMVFGVSSQGVYMTNPLGCVPETVLWPRLTSPSVLLVRTRDILNRFHPKTDLSPLTAVPDRRFHTMNVLGQVVNAIREWRASGWCEHGIRTRHISIPASYQAGITIVVLTGSEAHKRLINFSQLPIFEDDKDK